MISSSGLSLLIVGHCYRRDMLESRAADGRSCPGKEGTRLVSNTNEGLQSQYTAASQWDQAPEKSLFAMLQR